jgi:hypothetical protein
MRYLDYVIRIVNDKKFYFYSYRDNNAGTPIKSNSLIELNKYYHILVEFDSTLPNNQMKIYIN